MPSDVEMESEGERDREERRRKKKERSKSKEREKGRERSRSKGREKSKEREKKKHKKHKKEKKKHKKRDRSSEGDDTANEGGDTPEKKRNAEGEKTPTGRDKERDKTPEMPEIEKLPGLGKYDSDGEEGEIEEKKLEIERERRREYAREEEGEKKDDRKEYQRDEKRANSRDKRDGSRERERKKRRSRSRERKRSGERGRDRDTRDRDVGRENAFRSEGRENTFRSEGRDNSFRSERDNKDRDGRDKYRREERNSESKDGREKERGSEEPGELGGGSKEVASLSIEESNKMRAKLGLKPLNVANIVYEDDNPDMPGELIPGDRDKTRHLPPQHWGERDQQKKLVEKLGIKRDVRQIKTKLSVVKGLGESESDDDDAGKWVERQKKKVKEKEDAAKRAKAMEELDQEFGVQEIVEEGLKEKQQQEYSSRDLKGIRVEHSAEAFGESNTVLTLQDQDILSDKYQDVLVNVNIVDQERTKKSLANIKAGKDGYQAYDQEVVDELTGEVTRKDLLYQYQEELEGVKKDGFTLEGEGEFSEAVSRERELAKIRQKLRQQNAVSLETPAPKLATDYYTDREMMAFKKPKKKKKIRKKMLKADDLLAMTQESSLLPTNFGEKQKKRAMRIIDDDQLLPDGRLPEDHDDLPVVPDMTGMRFDREMEEDSRAMRALKVARKLTKVKTVDIVAEEVLRDSRENTVDMDDESGDGAHYSDLIIDQTQEFCRGLGEVGSYELSGLGETVDKELLDFEKSLESKRMRSAVEWSKMEDREDEKQPEKEVVRSSRGTWEEVDEEVVEEGRWKEGARRQQRRGGSSSSSNTGGGKAPYRPAILEDEALAATGMGAALKMALQKGYLDNEEKKIKSTGLVHLKCKNYNIDDKSRDHEEDDRKRRGGGRDRGYQGPTSSFSEKKGYKPEVTIEYVDDTGRAMNPKEAFRFLSHKFHGKGSGKLKTEKRQRKVLEDKLMEKMSSTDTPLNTLSKLQSKTKELATPYLVLSGNKHSMGGHTSLKK
eukprot:GFUD01029567.1.p1 GENE.GFUD01029567.1~~GFUD01029567.1.p1  ORF type:complete len:1005 (+),score=402.86 GFUD01029567.1:3093-6107(+)